MAKIKEKYPIITKNTKSVVWEELKSINGNTFKKNFEELMKPENLQAFMKEFLYYYKNRVFERKLESSNSKRNDQYSRKTWTIDRNELKGSDMYFTKSELDAEIKRSKKGNYNSTYAKFVKEIKDTNANIHLPARYDEQSREYIFPHGYAQLRALEGLQYNDIEMRHKYYKRPSSSFSENIAMKHTIRKDGSIELRLMFKTPKNRDIATHLVDKVFQRPVFDLTSSEITFINRSIKNKAKLLTLV